jgi:3-deoxy-D-manno-octulosonic-acid transferase
VALANARLSERSFRQARRFSALARPAYGALAAVWAQTEADAARLRALGANVAGVFGNLKFDATPDPDQVGAGRRWREAAGRPVILLASSREGEEEAFLKLVSAVPSVEWPQGAIKNEVYSDEEAGAVQVQWLIVPRHPQRFDEVAQRIEAHGLSVSRRSSWGGQPPRVSGAGDGGRTIWLGDSMGEMARYYALSDVALLGGSFEPLGGQNLIEAAACGCPVVMGPHTFNFAQAAELAEAGGAAATVQDMGAALPLALAWASDPAIHAKRVAAALAFAAAHRGAALRTTQAIVDLKG